jgi:ArsR family transcriptional regulator, arsenate/arsenite/antimonite-responsive transcriptional repressor
MVINMTKNDPVLFAKALADATRQKIMNLCCCKWLSVSEIVEQTNVSQPTVSHHLAVLREAGLVDVRHEGKQIFYTLDQDKVATCCGNLVMKFAPDSNTAEIFKSDKVT